MQETIKDKAQWKQTRLKARDAFLKARELGVSIPEIDLIAASIKADGGDKGMSDNPQAQATMNEAFPLFAAEGLLETYVLFVRADAGMKQDYPAFRQSNRDKLKRYLAQYVMKNGGN